MSDFREEFYRRYVTTFKRAQVDVDPRELESLFAWSRYRYLPLLEGVGPDEAILEVGCGPGILLAFLASSGFRNVEGIDLSAEQVELAKQRGMRAEVANMFDFLSGKTDAYAAIFAIDVFEHLTKQEVLDFLPLVRKALKPDGRLILQTANGSGLFPGSIIYGDMTHCTIFTPGSLEQVLRLTGFRDIRCFETGPVPKNAAGVVRVVLWGMVKAAANLVRKAETGSTNAIWTQNLICSCRRDG